MHLRCSLRQYLGYFFQYLDIILLLLVLIVAFPLKIMELVTLKSITLTDILDELYCPCSAGLISNFEGYNMNSIRVGIKN